MQTFLPYNSLEKSARCLDNKRLWKQVLEARTILRGYWKYHPAAKMWKNYEVALSMYMNYCLHEWQIVRKFKSSISLNFIGSILLPPWFGDERLHKSHRIALLTKNYDYYKQYNWSEKPDSNYKYYWPV